MDKPRSYKTRQRDVILDTLKASPQRHLTSEELAANLRAQGEDVGLATIYRNLDKLVKEGLVIKYTLPDGLSACYQYLNACHEHSPHCHVVCTSCGQVSHLDCAEMDALAQHLAGRHHFELDRQKTVLYGLCPQCGSQNGEHASAGSCCHSHAGPWGNAD